MELRDINNFFGDMDLHLMDAILKGLMPVSGSVLDLGCGAGRNAVYFLNQGYEYVGVDADDSQVQLCRFVTKDFEDNSVQFYTTSIQELDLGKRFDLIICSQVLHFAEDEADFFRMWSGLVRHLKSNGMAYVTLDSIINTSVGTSLGKKLDEGLVEFPDGKIRFALTEHLFDEMKKGFEEVEPLRTLVSYNTRAQSILLLRKIVD